MKIKLTDDSRADLRIIRDNLKAFNDSGFRFVDEITQHIATLSASSKIGPSLETKVDFPTGYRFLVFYLTKRQLYLIIYRINENDQVIYINRIFDGRSNYLNVLFKD